MALVTVDGNGGGLIIVKQTPWPRKLRSEVTVPELEATLEEWFGAPVVLTSSGRGAIKLAFAALGLNRYRHRVAMPRMITMCVLEAVVHHAFPVEAARSGEADLTLLYHQYGFPQVIQPSGPVIEDICHSFFAGIRTGRRAWRGQMAVFSLTKFFGINTMAGGIVVHDKIRAAELRRMRDAAPERSALQIGEECAVYCDPDAGSNPNNEKMRRSRLLNPRIFDRELGGVPKNVAQIAECGQRRRDIIAMYCDAMGPHGYPAGWRDMMQDNLPYFFPISADAELLSGATQRLREMGVEADLYSIDIERNMSAPRFARMLLIPCHDTIPDAALAGILSALKWVGRSPATLPVN